MSFDASWQRSNTRYRAVGRTKSDFLSEYWFQYVALEIPGTAEELFLALRESDSSLLLLCHERNGAHEIRNLKEPVFVRSHVLRELPFVAVSRRHGFVDEICDDGLTAIVIHFYLEVRNSLVTRNIEEFGNTGLELRYNMFLGSCEFLVDADASVAEWGFSGEGHHGGKYPIAHFPAHVFVAIFAPDKRSCMETKVREPHSGKRFIEFADGFIYALILIVGDERYNIEARRIVGNRKIAGLVDEYAQSRILIHAHKARAAGCPPLKAKNFLRVSVTPAFRLSSPCMISNLSSVCKGADFGSRLASACLGIRQGSVASVASGNLSVESRQDMRKPLRSRDLARLRCEMKLVEKRWQTRPDFSA